MSTDEINTNRSILPGVKLLTFLSLIAVVFFIWAYAAISVWDSNTAECVNEAVGCEQKSSGSKSVIIWIGVFLFSLMGLALMTFKSSAQRKGSAMMVGILSAAALNTLFWMIIIYTGAFLLKLF